MNGIRTILLAALVAATAVGCARDRDRDGDDEEYVDQLATAHERDTAAASVYALEPGMPVTGGPVSYTAPTGRTYTGYEVSPDAPDSVVLSGGSDVQEGAALPGIILVHEWWGLNQAMREQAERLAGEGYRVLAVDLFDGMATERTDEARRLAQQVMRDRENAMVNLVAAYNHLSQNRNAPRVAVMGYCFGGALALNAGMALPQELDAMVIYYGQVSTESDELERLEMPILGIFGGQDESIPVDQVRAFEDALTEAGRDAEVHIYDDARHAFANPAGANYDAEAAGEAWDVTKEFLAEHLRDQS